MIQRVFSSEEFHLSLQIPSSLCHADYISTSTKHRLAVFGGASDDDDTAGIRLFPGLEPI